VLFDPGRTRDALADTGVLVLPPLS